MASRVSCHSMLPDASAFSPQSGQAVVLARRTAVAGRPVRVDQAVALEPAEQGVDRALALTIESPLARSRLVISYP